MEKAEQRLKMLIEDLLTGNINCELFEEHFAGIYDCEEVECDEQTMSYFAVIRELLEKYSFSANDLKKYPEYYINCTTLKNRIKQLKEDNRKRLKS